ncbi:MAG: diacylglyceryl transferase [Betaproteobacteria bacterium]|nr:MAG: diacylglyceryl transferase [Betaproteobacteria bacterium]
MDARSALLVHAAFEMVAIGVGVQLYARNLRRDNNGSLTRGPAFRIAVGCLIGAILGSKLAVWMEYPDLIRLHWGSPQLAFSGQSIVGGLIGGLCGVEIAKRMSGVERSTGDAFVMPLIAGIVIGRIGCFLAGLHDDTFGVATTLPWGVDFGDGVRRHPTQLYDIAFVLALGAVLVSVRHRLSLEPGLEFKLFLSGYLAWRLGVDTLKPVPFSYAGDLSGLQLLAAVFLIAYTPRVARQMRRLA